MSKAGEVPVEDAALAIAGQEGGEVARAEDMFAQDAGAGMQNLTPNDFSIPFITILQKGSPQVDELSKKHVEGAKQGMIYNTVSGDLYDGQRGILAIPCAYQKFMVQWKPRESGGGLVSYHREGDPFLKQCKAGDRNRLVTPDGDIIVDTAYHLVVLVPMDDDGIPEQAVISMASTQLKKSRNWNTIMRKIAMKDKSGRPFNPPSFSHVYRLTTVGEAKDDYTWWGWSIVSEGMVTDPGLYKMAREFSRQATEGRVRISMPPQDFDLAEDTEQVPF